jgi:hypothetical protein
MQRDKEQIAKRVLTQRRKAAKTRRDRKPIAKYAKGEENAKVV